MSLEITVGDFERLTTNSMEGGSHWLKQQDRFEPVGVDDYEFLHSVKYRFLHWCESYTAVMLCRAYLDNNKLYCRVAWDIAAMEYVIFTNYPGPFKDKK